MFRTNREILRFERTPSETDSKDSMFILQQNYVNSSQQMDSYLDRVAYFSFSTENLFSLLQIWQLLWFSDNL